MDSLLISLPDRFEVFPLLDSTSKDLPKSIPTGNLDAARLAYRLKVESWKSLELRQTFADEDFMRSHIKAAGLRSPHNQEPATSGRLHQLLFKAGLRGMEVRDAIGTTLPKYLALNPSLPLWAALAQVLEATGKFTQKAYELSKGAAT
jgi:hypothetical protein